jgi:hypothetical protein
VGQDYSPFWDYGLSKYAEVTPEWQTYTFTFRSAATTTDERSNLYLGFGAYTGTFHVDDIRLIPDDLTQINNPSFEQDTISYWSFWANGGIASYDVDCGGDATDGSCAVAIDFTSTNNFWDVGFAHDSLDVDNTETYLLTFDAKADDARNIKAELSQAHSPWSTLAPTVTVSLDSEWTHYVVPFVANADDTNARIVLYMGDDDESVYVDNVRFWKSVDTKITDMTPEFSGVYDDPDSPDTATSYRIQVEPYWADFSR